MLRAGDLRHLVTIQKPESNRDSFGQSNPTWVLVCTTRAKIEPLDGSEALDIKRSGSLAGEVTHQVTIRYRTGIKPSMRMLFKGRVLSIVSVVNTDERNAELVLMCGEAM